MTLSKKTVSVVIPMYNSSGTIQGTLNSVKNQTCKDFEIIVVDDGSTDNCAALVEEYITENQDLNISLIKKRNGGVSTARNAGMRAAQGDYIALLDADDEWDKQKLQEQLTVLEADPAIDLLGCNRNGQVLDSFLSKKFSRLTPISARFLMYKNFFSTPTVIFKRKILTEIGFFDETQRYAEEGNYWLRICNKNNCMLLNESYVLTGGGKPDFGFSGLSSNLKEMEKGELKNLREALRLNVVGIFEYSFLVVYSVLKYIRRLVIVKLRKK